MSLAAPWASPLRRPSGRTISALGQWQRFRPTSQSPHPPALPPVSNALPFSCRGVSDVCVCVCVCVCACVGLARSLLPAGGEVVRRGIGPPPSKPVTTDGGLGDTLSSSFVRQHLMQASAAQSIAAKQQDLYPAMPDVCSHRCTVLVCVGLPFPWWSCLWSPPLHTDSPPTEFGTAGAVAVSHENVHECKCQRSDIAFFACCAMRSCDMLGDCMCVCVCVCVCRFRFLSWRLPSCHPCTLVHSPRYPN